MSNYYTHGAGRAPSPEQFDYQDRFSGSKYPSASAPAPQSRPLKSDYYEMHEEREPSFDVRADFDGEGPRWSEMYGVAKQETYRPVYDHDVQSTSGAIGALKASHSEYSPNDPELVTVPVLGAEWTKGELREASRRGAADRTREKRNTKFKAWNRDQRGCCGISWLTRRVFVFIMFVFIAALIVTLYFTIPRAVNFQFYQDQPFKNTSAIYYSRQPANWSFTADLQLLADSSTSYVPVHFSNAQATLMDSTTQKVIATGNLKDYTIPHKKDVPVVFPVQFSYAPINDSDTTWNNLYNACKHQYTGVVRTELMFRLEIKQSIVGVVSKPISMAQLAGITCPFQTDD